MVAVALGALVWCGAGCNERQGLGDALNHAEFRCYTVSESARTVGASRVKRKTLQLKRIKRLLEEVKKLEPLDDAKLRSERAVLMADIADAEFQRQCAEAYFTPSRTTLREQFAEPPVPVNLQAARDVFETVKRDIAPRLWPHGFEGRADAFIAEAKLQNQELADVREQARAQIEDRPEGLYTDTYKLIMADALVGEGKLEEALKLYEDVGRLRIGFDAHYARYRAGRIYAVLGDAEKAKACTKDVLRWARNGERTALVRFLKSEAPIPPRLAPLGS